MLYELQLPYREMSEGELRLSLMDFLKPGDACPEGMLLLVDEAHMLPTELLDEIRLITNYVRDGQPRVRLVMAGNFRLEENLNDPRLDSLNQRIASRCYLSNLSQSETAKYVITHVDRAGGDGAESFAESALREIHNVTDGCPRFINQVAEHAMILAATRAISRIESTLVEEAWHDVQSLPGTFSNSAGQTATSAVTPDDQDWTVIEFGSLDDQDDDPANLDRDGDVDQLAIRKRPAESLPCDELISGSEQDDLLESEHPAEAKIDNQLEQLVTLVKQSEGEATPAVSSDLTGQARVHRRSTNTTNHRNHATRLSHHQIQDSTIRLMKISPRKRTWSTPTGHWSSLKTKRRCRSQPSNSR